MNEATLETVEGRETGNVAPLTLPRVDVLQHPDVQETLRQIAVAQETGADWEDDFEPVPVAVAERANVFIVSTVRNAAAQARLWVKPAVSPTPDGGIHLSWHRSGKWATFTLLDGIETVEFVYKDGDSPSQREVLEADEVVNRVLRLLPRVNPSNPVGSSKPV